MAISAVISTAGIDAGAMVEPFVGPGRRLCGLPGWGSAGQAFSLIASAALLCGAWRGLYAGGVIARDGAGGDSAEREMGTFAGAGGLLRSPFLEHTLVPHFHFGEETHAHEFLS